jgi:hypothetical protein
VVTGGRWQVVAGGGRWQVVGGGSTMLKVHMANIKSADQIALTTTLLAFRT